MTSADAFPGQAAAKPPRRSGIQVFELKIEPLRGKALCWTPDLAMALRAKRSGVRQTIHDVARVDDVSRIDDVRGCVSRSSGGEAGAPIRESSPSRKKN